MPWIAALAAVLLLALAQRSASAQTATPPSVDTPQSDFVLEKLGFGDQTAVGIGPTLSFFVPGPGDYTLAPSGSYLDLIFNHSPLLQEQLSTMTIALNDSDLSAVRLGPQNANAATLRVPLPTDRIVPGFNKITLKFAMGIDDNCGDLNNPALFTRIQRETLVHWQYAPGTPLKDPNTDLALFPYPFVRNGYTRGGSTLFVLSANAGQRELTAAATLAATMARLGGGTELRIKATQAESFQTADAANNDIVVIGTPASNALVTRVDPGATSSPAGSGRIHMSASPFNSQRAALVVSGDTDESLLRAAFALADARTRPGLSGDTAGVRDMNTTLAPFPIEAPDRSFALFELGISNFTATGLGAQPLTVILPSISPDPSADARLRLLISHSAVMDERRSNMRIAFNGIGLTSVGLDSSNRERTPVDVTIPQRVLHAGVNSLTIDFNMHLTADNDDSTGLCRDIAPERAWTSLYDDSSIDIQGGPPPSAPDVSYFPFPYVQTEGMSGTFLVTSQNPETLRQSLQMAASLGRRNRAVSDAIGMTTGAQLTPDQKRDYYLLAVGRPTQNPFVGELAASMPIQLEPNSDRVLVDRSAVAAVVKDAGNLGLYEVATSPYNERRWSGIVTGTSEQNLDLIRTALAASLNRGTVVIARAPDDVREVRLLPVATEKIERQRSRAELIFPALTLLSVAATAGLAGFWVYTASRKRAGRAPA